MTVGPDNVCQPIIVRWSPPYDRRWEGGLGRPEGLSGDSPASEVYVSMEPVDLPVQPPLEPMLAKAATKVPDDPGVWSYEPKWDGFLH